MVNVGVVGLGPDWDSRFRPALRKLRERIAVRALYDPVASRAAQIAAEWNVDAVDGLVALSRRSDIRALLLLDAGWSGWESVRLLCAAAKPVFILSGLSHDQSALRLLHDRATALGQTVMPAFGLRYTPATCRLRELMATRLGPPTAITVDVALPPIGGVAGVEAESSERRPQTAHSLGAPADQPRSPETFAPFVGLIDWCQYVVGSSPLRIHAVASNGATESHGVAGVEAERRPQSARSLGAPAGRSQPPATSGSSVRLEFNDTSDSSATVRAELRIPALPQPSARCSFVTDVDAPARVRATVVCQRGTATLESGTQIVWQDGDKSVCETLTSERTETEVMLDLFCRRVVGGLIPVADISDVLRGARLLEAARHSLQSGKPVEIPHVG
jgi:predicted dehydrogenase